ncbi:putative glycerol-3-phosphate acyltransferase 3-like [Hibiscus syriacus]|uniref:Glycerol-3-phosphate acyltransferase 3-like n=1 Tax=Hibiscus syriacus TaxID=106335 RepID=A0A6A3A3S8_HIBSY|nr:putative glycerol-3-phosphate acyltransferase 3-like [Hibiscus syriacus]
MEFLVDKSSEGEENREPMALVEINFAEDKCKKTNSRKPPKPPLPPKGPLLDAADQELVREIVELTMRKRARMKRIKAMKKMKAASSSNSSLFAMVITVIFCLCICYRRGANVMIHGSPAPEVGSSESLILIQFYRNFPAFEKHDQDPPRGSETDDVELSDCTLMALRYHELADQRKGGN